MKHNRFGFTIVELLIVIVVIGILAAISIVAYNNVQKNARDNARAQAVSQIQKALEMYRAEYGRYPYVISSGANLPSGFTGLYNTGYSYSIDTAGNWMKYLKDSGITGDLPVDPINNTEYYFIYHAFNGGIGACTEPVYILVVSKYENPANRPAQHSLNCTGNGVTANWNTPYGATFSNLKTPGT